MLINIEKIRVDKILTYILIGAWAAFIAWLVMLGLLPQITSHSPIINVGVSFIKAGILSFFITLGLIISEIYTFKKSIINLFTLKTIKRLLYVICMGGGLMAITEMLFIVFEASIIRVIAWGILGFILGFSEPYYRIWLSAIAGFIGGLIGGMLFDFVGSLNMAFSQSFSIILISVCIAFCLIFINEITKKACLLIEGIEFPLLGKATLLGSSDKPGNIGLLGDGIEPEHALIKENSGNYLLTAFGSLKVNNISMKLNEQVILKHGDIIDFNNIKAIFVNLKEDL